MSNDKDKLKKIFSKYVDIEFKKNLNYKKSFQDLGIDSLKSVQLLTEIEKRFDIFLKSKDLNDKSFKALSNFEKIVLKSIGN
tara:strand:- start:940 stop:1185 length:246 start_codon:yes stop_codon:yes gene_type:complete